MNHRFLTECFDYNPSSGHLTWKTRPVEHFKNAHGWRIFNSKYSGRTAGYLNVQGYVAIKLGQVFEYGHRIAWVLTHGKLPVAGIDHIDGDTSNNRIENLREATQSQNGCNTKTPLTNTSGHKGISLIPSSGRWVAYITINRRKKHLGCFTEIENAISARKQAEKQLHGSFARS